MLPTIAVGAGGESMSVGDRVMHDFSRVFGTIVAIDRTTSNRQYPYKVQWDDSKEDWYTRNVLIVVKKARKSSTQV
jgi:hypothetical protein